MADSLGAKHYGIMQVLDCAVVGLACVEEHWHALRRLLSHHHSLLSRKDLFGELADFWGEVLLVDHVEAGNELCKTLVFVVRAFSYMLDHLFDVTLS